MVQKKWLTLLLVPAITLGSMTLPAPKQAAAATSGAIVASVSLRENPKTSADRIRYLKAGESVSIIQKVNNWWYEVKDQNGRTGYISTNARYVKTTVTPPSGGTSDKPPVPDVPAGDKAKLVIEAGKKYMGTPYEFGSSRSSTATFDCSDFVRQAFLDGLNRKLPSDSRGQGEYIKNLGRAKSDWRQLQPGDLMFFMEYRGSKASYYTGVNKNGQKITHVGIYLGDGKILHTYSKTSGGVRIDSIEGKHWEYRFLFGGNAIN